jgi:hypothetical protein
MIYFKQAPIAVVLAALLLVVSTALAHDVTIGGVAITIPEPSGFVAVTPQMSKLFEFDEQFVTPTNQGLVTFISEPDAEIASQGEIPDMTRRFSVQTLKSLMMVPVSHFDFEVAKRTLKSSNETISKQLERDAPGVMDKISKGFSKELDANVAFSIADAIPFPPHLETDRLLAFSMVLKYNIDTGAGEPTSMIVAATTTLAHVRGKVLYLYCFADEADLDWTKEVSKSWAEAVVAENPSDLGTAVDELLPPAVARVKWLAAGIVLILGAILASVLGLGILLIYLRSRKAKNVPRV